MGQSLYARHLCAAGFLYEAEGAVWLNQASRTKTEKTTRPVLHSGCFDVLLCNP